MTARSRQRGAALIVVLLLAATLALIVMGVSEVSARAAARSSGLRAKDEMEWRALGLEVLAESAIGSELKIGKNRLTRASLLLSRPLVFDADDGKAIVQFSDSTRCFNMNALDSNEASVESAASELRELLASANVGGANPRAMVAETADWIDDDLLQAPGGAEDGAYLGLPQPYRTGGGKLADVSELRAIRSFDAKTFAQSRRWLCALPTADPSPINVNLLLPEDAPLLVGMMNGAVSLSEARRLIEQTPFDGYSSLDQFWQKDAFAGKEISQGVRDRTALSSQYVTAHGTLAYSGRELHFSMLFEVQGGRARLLSRKFGLQS